MSHPAIMRFMHPIRYYLFRNPAKIALLCFGLPIVGVLMALSPLVKVRVGVLHNFGGLGHLAWNNELYLRRQTRRQSRKWEFHLFITGKPANRQVLKMIKRRMHVVENRLLLPVFRRVRAVSPSARVWIDLSASYNSYDEANNIPPQMSFTPEEEERGQELLRSMGIGTGSPYICFHVRERSYFEVVRSDLVQRGTVQEFRNGSIKNYLPAAEHLASQGLFAVRMGYLVNEKIESTSDRLIDYASEFRSDFGDAFLPARCKFFLGSPTGINDISMTMGVPRAIANLIPMLVPPLGKNELFIPKKLWHIQEKRFLTFRERANSAIDELREDRAFAEAGLEVIENTAQEILVLATEMNHRLDGTWITSEEDENLQRLYKALFPPGHNCHGFPSRIGAEFLRENRALLEA